jgi:hypothetical protein
MENTMRIAADDKGYWLIVNGESVPITMNMSYDIADYIHEIREMSFENGYRSGREVDGKVNWVGE